MTRLELQYYKESNRLHKQIRQVIDSDLSIEEKNSVNLHAMLRLSELQIKLYRYGKKKIRKKTRK